MYYKYGTKIYRKTFEYVDEELEYIGKKVKDNNALKEKELEMKSFRNQSIIGLLLLVFLGIIVF